MMSRLPAPEDPTSKSAKGMRQDEPASVTMTELLLELAEAPIFPAKLAICAPLLTTSRFIAPLLPTKSDWPSPQTVLLPERNAVLALAPGLRPRTPLPWLVSSAAVESRRLFAKEETPT